jgi:hypothetical protein
MNFSSWWGRHTIEPNRSDLWQLGPMRVWIQHSTHEWRVAWHYSGDLLDSTVRSVPGARNEMPPSEAKVVNCVFGSAAREDLIFSPSLPDRSVITRPSTPLFILPNEKVTLYVVNPLWLRIEMPQGQNQAAKLIQEIPTYQLSDTWFGPMSSAGELCYASTAPAYLDLKEVPLRLHCAISSVSIRNSGFDALRLDRIQVPLSRLSLFYSPRTGFWTNSFSFERRDDNEMAAIKLEAQPPAEASPSQFVTGPRTSTSESGVIRAFSALFKERSHA